MPFHISNLHLHHISHRFQVIAQHWSSFRFHLFNVHVPIQSSDINVKVCGCDTLHRTVRKFSFLLFYSDGLHTTVKLSFVYLIFAFLLRAVDSYSIVMLPLTSACDLHMPTNFQPNQITPVQL